MELIDHLKSLNFNLLTGIKSIDLSTFHTSMHHKKLKTNLYIHSSHKTANTYSARSSLNKWDQSDVDP